jgi:CRISPR-associated endoribonuclease Cas6
LLALQAINYTGVKDGLRNKKMRISISFVTENGLILPLSYNYAVQSLILRHIDEKLGQFLHDKGYMLGKRSFKMFTFSRILGKVKFLLSQKQFKIGSPFKIVISSPIKEFIQSLAENLVKTDGVTLAGTRVYLESINVYLMPKLNEETFIEMLSPVTVYSTLKTPEGKKKTYYYTPFEADFSRLICENLRKKYKALYGKDANSLAITIEPVKVSKKSLVIVNYKGTVIKGWLGRYKITGSPELIALAYDAGLGSKNSQGFGCFEVIA